MTTAGIVVDADSDSMFAVQIAKSFGCPVESRRVPSMRLRANAIDYGPPNALSVDSLKFDDSKLEKA